VVSFRTAISSLREQAAAAPPPRLVRCAARLCRGEEGALLLASPRVTPRLHAPEEEIAYGPAAWLWDYLRRSGGRFG
jgi:NAD+ synthase (glutamine-hydrolysing)